MLDAQEEAEEQLEAIAGNALDAAEDQFAAYMKLRGYDRQVHDFMSNQPLYKPCNRDTHAIQAKREATQFIRQAMGSTSRFDCGVRQQSIRAAAKAFITGTMAEQETQNHFEKELEDAYLENHYDGIVSAVTGSDPGSLAGAFGTSAAIWAQQYQNASNQAAGAVAGVGYFGANAIGGLFSGNSDSNRFSGYGNASPVTHSFFT